MICQNFVKLFLLIWDYKWYQTIDIKVQKSLLSIYKGGLLTKMVYDRIWPTAYQRSWMYGLTKVRKEGISYRPIQSVMGSVQHEIFKWLAVLF